MAGFFQPSFFQTSFFQTGPPVTYSANLIPAMTSATAPSGVASADSVYNGAYLYSAWRAFNHANAAAGDQWLAEGAPHWLAYEFAAAHIVTQYTVAAQFNVGNYPSAWTFEGYNGSTWDVLDTRSDVTWAVGETKTYPITNSTSYTKYRINISGAPEGAIAVGELEMMETVDGTVPLAAIGNIALAGSADLLGFFAVVGLDASGTIELAGASDLFAFFSVVGMDASGSISLAGSASIVMNLAFLEADGTISLEGEYADLCQWGPMAAVGTIALCGEAWLSDALHGDDTLQAIGTIELR